MPPPNKNRIQHVKKTNSNFFIKFYNNYLNWNFLESLIFDPAQLPIVAAGILLLELILNVFVVQRVRYTEIDWIAYMQECEGFLNGTTNYALLRGDTGPLVYPAGFIYIYTAFYYLTGYGKNIRLAQYIFIVMYLLQMFLVLRIYAKTRKVPPYVLVLSAFTSYRIHSIYILRLFNDPIAILFLYAAINFFLDGKWNIGSIFFSLGVSVKMNILLFAPAVLLFYIVNLGYFGAVKQLIICALVQLVLGAPFLFTYPLEYIKGSFDLGRIFDHKWTVNYRFLPREYFEHKYFHIGLLVLHLALLAIFMLPAYKYFQSYCRLRELQSQFMPQIAAKNKEQSKSRKRKVKSEVTDSDESLNKQQKHFLQSFEAGLKRTHSTEKKTNVTEQNEKQEQSDQKYEIFFDKSVQLAILPLFLCNFIGMICARSLHYQFYVWYFHTLPYLVWFTEYNNSLKFLLLGLIEFAWNTYPSTNLSSYLLHCSHLILLYGIGRNLFRSYNVRESKNE